MNKPVGICGTSGSITGAAFMDVAESLRRVGQNTGNLVFQYSVCNQITGPRLLAGEDLKWNAKAARESCRALVVPSANFLREGFDFTGFVNFLENTNLPLVILGLGGQADDYTKKEFDFHSSVKRFISLIKERCEIIGVRGQYTAEVLEASGVHNFEVMGCPSNFLNPDPDLPRRLEAKWQRRIERVMTNGDSPWPKSDVKRNVERALVRIAKESSGLYVQQSSEPLVRLIRGANIYQSESDSQAFTSIRRALAPDSSAQEFAKFIRTQARVYFCVDQWLEDASRFDLSLGVRLHGNMVAMQSGTPSVWIYHDARTQELAETMELPRLAVSEFAKLEGDLTNLKSVVEGNWVSYGKRRIELYARYRRILEKGGVALRDSAEQVAI